ncbi:MAG: hypothetical protein LBT35_05180 [Tannerella sp.]|jgi:hypothetical protein|nr:hypothetical protein [Tannerella sp.]
MANNEKLKQIISNLQVLGDLTKTMLDTEIYPVSFFSQAYDLMQKLQGDVHALETEQVEMFATRMKEHQALMLSIHQQMRNIEGVRSYVPPPTTVTPPTPQPQPVTPQPVPVVPQPVPVTPQPAPVVPQPALVTPQPAPFIQHIPPQLETPKPPQSETPKPQPEVKKAPKIVRTSPTDERPVVRPTVKMRSDDKSYMDSLLDRLGWPKEGSIDDRKVARTEGVKKPPAPVVEEPVIVPQPPQPQQQQPQPQQPQQQQPQQEKKQAPPPPPAETPPPLPPIPSPSLRQEVSEGTEYGRDVQSLPPTPSPRQEPTPSPRQEPVSKDAPSVLHEAVVLSDGITAPPSLNDMIEKKKLKDLRKAFSLNDYFRYRRELFGGSEEAIYNAIEVLNGKETLKDALIYLEGKLRLDLSDPIAKDFIKILELRYL